MGENLENKDAMLGQQEGRWVEQVKNKVMSDSVTQHPVGRWKAGEE